MKFKYIPLLFLICGSIFSSIPANSTIVVRMEVQRGVNTETIDIKLFNNLTPVTVANFLQYINDGDYVNSFFHRTVSNFIIQGGGFTFDPLLNDGTFTFGAGGVQNVPADPAIINEFSKSNTFGTIAMAKIPGNPDSATNQWFVNLADNPSLDTQNGGFTVFGEIINNGMSNINLLAAVPVFDMTSVDSAFGALPLDSYASGSVDASNLLTTTAFSERFSVSSSYGTVTIVGDTIEPEDIDFGIVTVGSVVTATVTIENRDVNVLTIGNIANIDLLAVPYQIISNACLNTSLSPNTTCDITIRFTSVDQGTFDDTLNIEFTSMNLTYTLNIHGESSLTPPASDIVLSATSVEFDETQIYDFVNTPTPEFIDIQITNQGNLDLNISSISIVGQAFASNSDCVTGGAIKSTESCNLSIAFVADSVGAKSGTITIDSDDPDNAILNIPISGIAGLDNDTVLTTIEDLAPNNGDGNNDDVLDSSQNNVISIDTGNGYITILVEGTASFTGFSLVDNPQLSTLPDNVSLTRIYQYETSTTLAIPNGNGSFSGGANVGIILPKGVVPKSYYMYGPTPEDINPHWYEFTFDGRTGAQIIGDANLGPSPSGKTVTRSLINLVFVDGERGDGDLVANGRISIQGSRTGASENSKAGDGGGGSLAFFTLLLMVSSLFLRLRQGIIKY